MDLFALSRVVVIHRTCAGSAEECHSTNPVELELQVVSLQPRAFVIPHFLSDFEIEDIIRLAEPRMSKSIVGDGETGSFESTTRTSRNGWLGRQDTDVTKSLFARAEHLLHIPELTTVNTEDIQVVHYKVGQKYDSHHDWGVSGYPESRYITLLLYLSDMPSPDAGGETAFPKGADGAGFKVHPGKGSAVLFYNLLEDGNGDDLAAHAALPVHSGEKWLANFWVWDPKKK
jgi:prolyl 4-hydroxylase